MPVDLPPAYELIELESVDSTNEEARRHAKGGAEEGTLIWAREQRSGRGRGGRSWHSPPGNMYCSVILRPELPAAQAVQVGFAASLAVGATVGAFVPPLTEMRYKWPNDVLVSDRKIAGILLESSMTPTHDLVWLIVGVGLNVTSTPEDPMYPATSLEREGAENVSVEAALTTFSRQFLTWINRWLDDGFEPLRAAWLSRAKGLNEPMEVRLASKTSLHGVFQGLDASGALLLDVGENDTRQIAFGDVFFASQED